MDTIVEYLASVGEFLRARYGTPHKFLHITNAIIPPVCMVLFLMFTKWMLDVAREKGAKGFAKYVWNAVWGDRGGAFAFAFITIVLGVFFRFDAISDWRLAGAATATFPWLKVGIGSLLIWFGALCTVRILAADWYRNPIWVATLIWSLIYVELQPFLPNLW